MYQYKPVHCVPAIEAFHGQGVVFLQASKTVQEHAAQIVEPPIVALICAIEVRYFGPKDAYLVPELEADIETCSSLEETSSLIEVALLAVLVAAGHSSSYWVASTRLLLLLLYLGVL